MHNFQVKILTQSSLNKIHLLWPALERERERDLIWKLFTSIGGKGWKGGHRRKQHARATLNLSFMLFYCLERYLWRHRYKVQIFQITFGLNQSQFTQVHAAEQQKKISNIHSESMLCIFWTFLLSYNFYLPFLKRAFYAIISFHSQFTLSLVFPHVLYGIEFYVLLEFLLIRHERVGSCFRISLLSKDDEVAIVNGIVHSKMVF
jgi:hypothetical protein